MLHGAGVTKLWCRNIDQQLLRELHVYEIFGKCASFSRFFTRTIVAWSKRGHTWSKKWTSVDVTWVWPSANNSLFGSCLHTGRRSDASFWLQVTAHRFGSGPGAHHDQTGFCSSCVTGISRTGLCYGTGSMPEVRLCTALTGVSGDSCARCLKNKLQFIGQLT